MLALTDRPDVEMIRCSNADCHLGTWYHVDCMGLDSIPDGDWWCSDECRQTESSINCFCKKVRTGDEVKCSNDDCMNGSTFHLECVHLQQKPTGYFPLLDHFKTLLWPPYVIGQAIIFLPCGFFLSFIFYLSFFIPRLISAAADWTQNVAKNRRLGIIAQLCRAISLQLRHVSTIWKKTC